MTTKITGVFYCLNGLAMFTLWPILIITGQVPELNDQLIYMLFHLFSELVAALLGLVTGVSLWIDRDWAKRLYFWTTGLLLAAGYLAIVFYVFTPKSNSWGILTMLATITSFQAILLVLLFNTYFQDKRCTRAKLTLIFNGALVYTLINVAGFLTQIGTGYTAGYASMVIILIGAGIWSSKDAWQTMELVP